MKNQALGGQAINKCSLGGSKGGGGGLQDCIITQL